MKPTLPVLVGILLLTLNAAAQPCTPLGNEITYGTNNVWIGYVYDNVNLTTYMGYVNQGTASSPDFDQSFGGDNVMYPTNGCSVSTNTFSVRYRLHQNFTNAAYAITVGGDDGYRLSVDGGVTWVINRWNDQGYVTTTQDVVLNGAHDLVLEYYENGGSNRISFQMVVTCSGTENTTVYGTNNIWNGYVYDGTNFEAYKGMVHEGTSSSPDFNELFGGDNVSYPTSGCTVQTETFSVRYRLTKNFVHGSYNFVVGADDGYRLSLDGGATWPINNWTAHSYTSSSFTTTLNGPTNMVLEYYEAGTNNRVSFQAQTLIVLPVHLLSFSGQTQSQGNSLKWTVSANSDPSHFIIQRSADGRSFVNLDQQPANPAKLNYNYTDNTPLSNQSYYRLQLTDRNGAVTYSETLLLRSSTASVTSELSIFPTVSTGAVYYIASKKTLTAPVLMIRDMNGRLLHRKTLGSITAGQTMALSAAMPLLAKGVYLLSVAEHAQLVGSQRIVIH